MKGLSLELWIRYKLYRQSGGSIFWRSVCRHIHWILRGLSWQIGNGHSLCIGLDPYASLKDDSYRLPDHMVITLQNRGLDRLANIGQLSDNHNHYWLDNGDLGFTGSDCDIWDRYLGLLYRDGIRLSTNADTLIWDFSLDGCITVKSLYDHMITELPVQEQC